MQSLVMPPCFRVVSYLKTVLEFVWVEEVHVQDHEVGHDEPLHCVLGGPPGLLGQAVYPQVGVHLYGVLQRDLTASTGHHLAEQGDNIYKYLIDISTN